MFEKLNFKFLDNFKVLTEDFDSDDLPPNLTLYVNYLYNRRNNDVVVRTYGKQTGKSHKKNIRFITIGFKEDVLVTVMRIHQQEIIKRNGMGGNNIVPDVNSARVEVNEILTGNFNDILESPYFADLIDRFITNFMNKFINGLRDLLSTNNLKPIYFQGELESLIPRIIASDNGKDYPYLMVLLPILIHKGNIYSIDVSRLVKQGEPYIVLINGGAIKNGHRYFTILTHTRSSGVVNDRYNHVITVPDVAAKQLPKIYEAFIKQQTRLQMGYTLSEIEDKLRKMFTVEDRKTIIVRKSIFTHNPLDHNVRVIADLYYLRLDLHTVKERETGPNKENPYLKMSLLTDNKSRVVYKGFLYLPFSTGFTMIILFKDFDTLHKFLNDFISNINNMQRMIMKEIVSLIDEVRLNKSNTEDKRKSIIEHLKDYIASSLIYGGGLSVEGVILANNKNGFKRAYTIHGKDKQFYLSYMTEKGVYSTIYDLLIGDTSSYKKDIKDAQETLEKVSFGKILDKYDDIKNLELKEKEKMYDIGIIENLIYQVGFLPFLFDSKILDKWVADYINNNKKVKVMLNAEFFKDLYKNFPDVFKKQAIMEDWSNFINRLQSQGIDADLIEVLNDLYMEFLNSNTIKKYIQNPKLIVNNLKKYISAVKSYFHTT